MAVTILIPITHRGYARGQKAVSVDTAATLAEAMACLEAAFPDLEGRILADKNRIVPGMEIALNGKPVYPFAPDLGISHGDEIRIASIITGG